jgi:CBS domain-containing protein
MTAIVADILRLKGTRVYTVNSGARVIDAVESMNVHRIGSVLVTDGGPLHGLVSERDILQRVVAQRRDPERTLVAEIMTPSPRIVRPDTTVEDAMKLVTLTRCRHLPVVGPRGLAGVISSGDLAAWDARSLRSELLQMLAYIHGPFCTRGQMLPDT